HRGRSLTNIRQDFCSGAANYGGNSHPIKLFPTNFGLVLCVGNYFGGSGSVADDDMKMAIAALMGIVALGGFAGGQWLKYQHQTFKYHIELTENMYFRNVRNNADIFDYLITATEDQECKEAVLAYHFSHKAEPAPMAGEIAARIEAWIEKNFEVNLDFKVADAIETLNRFGLVRRDGDRLFVPPLEPAIAQLHQVWNNFFKR